jgi:hypothetical protein
MYLTTFVCVLKADSRSLSFTFLKRMPTEKIARLCHGSNWRPLIFRRSFVKTIRDSVKLAEILASGQRD